MAAPSSSTSSSSPVFTWAGSRDTVVVAAWVVVWLVIGDVAIDFALRYPDPKVAEAGILATFFERGRSMEGKLRRDVREDWQAPGTRHGWLVAEELAKDLPAQAGPDHARLVSIYGMSFSKHVGQALAELDPKLRIRHVGAAEAPPNHSYTAYLLDRRQHGSDIVVLGILASTVPRVATQTSLTWQFDRAYGYSHPRYDVSGDGSLRAIWPKVRTFEDLKAALSDPGLWEGWLEDLAENDLFHDSFSMRGSWTDRSTLLRLVRRAWNRRHRTAVTNELHPRDGYDPESGFVRALNLMVRDFAETAEEDGRIPVVVLFHDQGQSDHLFRALESTLREHGIRYVSSHATHPPTDASNYVEDGHFTHEANLDFARQLLDRVAR